MENGRLGKNILHRSILRSHRKTSYLRNETSTRLLTQVRESLEVTAAAIRSGLHREDG